MTEARIELPPLPAPDFPDYEAYSDTTMREYARAAVLAERERAARVAENMPEPDGILSSKGLTAYMCAMEDIAAAIRKGD
jgi:hypothetical protein